MMRSGLIAVSLILSVLAAATPAAATAYYVSPAGDDANDGTSAAKAFRSIDRAAKLAKAGDVVNILPGTYVGRIRPANSGTPDAPITYRKVGDGEAVITTSKETDGGKWEERAAFRLAFGNNYTVVEGLTFRDAESWFYIGDYAHHNTVRNCTFERCRMNHGIYVNSASYTTITGCRFLEAIPFPDDWGPEHEEFASSDYITVWRDSHYTLIDNCEFHAVPHVAVCFMGHDPEFRPRFNVVRRCTFDTPRWKCVSFHACEPTLVELNEMSGLAASFIQYQASRAIVRRNIFRDYVSVRVARIPRDYHGPIWLRSVINEYGGVDDARLGRIYSNTWYNCQKAVTHGPRATALPVCENVFKNNIMVKIAEPLRLPLPFYAHYTVQNANYFFRNVMLRDKPGDVMFELLTVEKRQPFTLAEATAKSRELCKRQIYADNLEVDPLLLDEAARDLRLKEGSPCIDAGAALTVTRTAGKGTKVIVEDPFYFCDGWDLIPPDSVVVGTNKPARLVNVDYDLKVLTVDRELSWKAGDRVNLPYEGKAPDIGAYELGAAKETIGCRIAE